MTHSETAERAEDPASPARQTASWRYRMPGIREPGQEEEAPEEDGAGEEEEVRDRIWQRSS